jgi:hypothetical protein
MLTCEFHSLRITPEVHVYIIVQKLIDLPKSEKNSQNCLTQPLQSVDIVYRVT